MITNISPSPSPQVPSSSSLTRLHYRTRVLGHWLYVVVTVVLGSSHGLSMSTYWATHRCHSDLSRAATSASSKVSTILRRSFLTTPLQFVLGGPGPLLKPGTSQCSARCGMRWWSIHYCTYISTPLLTPSIYQLSQKM